MAILTVVRSSEYTNRLRNIKIFLDEKELGTIANGQSKDFEIAAGTHSLKAKIDWCSSNTITFTIAENGRKTFSMDSFAKHSSLGIFAAIYYITFGAGKYLNLKEI